ncbi:MAG: phage tail assembly protein [Desulfobacterales bacterium]|nr:phage tail assembly protein [Desulfobacterales bacterium]
MPEKNKKEKHVPPYIERPDDLTRIVYLEFPLELGKEGDQAGIIDKLTLGRPTVGDILETSRQGTTEDERRVFVVAKMTKQLPSLIEKLYASDWDVLNDAYDELRFPKQKLAVSGES